MTGRHSSYLLCFFLMGFLPATAQTNASWDEAVEWVQRRAIPLATPEPGQGFADLRKLRPSIGTARIVGMGEATHGTREFFQLKHRVFEYLVEEHGFRLFGLEASYAGCLPIDHYIQTGEGNVRALIKGQGFWTWDTEEVLALVEWMRGYNAKQNAPEDRVHFYGIDTQDAATPLRLALAQLAKFEPKQAEHLEQQLTPAIASRYPNLRNGSLEDYQAVIRAIEDLRTRLSRHRDTLRDQLGERGYARVHFAAEAGRYAVMANRPSGNDPEPKAIRNIRDETMARVVDWVLEQHGNKSRIMLWAHDGHVTRYKGDPQKDRPFLGSFLEAKYGEDYVPIGFSFAKGGFQALYWPKPGEDWSRRVLDEYQIESTIPESIDLLLSRAGHDLFVLDLRPIGDDKMPSWLKQPRVRRSIGGLFDGEDAEGPRFTQQVVLPEHFEMMVFVSKTTRALPLTPPARFLFGAWTKDSEAGGALVTGVGTDSIAQRAGIQAGDIIRQIGSFKIVNAQDLYLALSRLDQPGKVAVHVLRTQKDGNPEPKTQYIQVPNWVREQ